MKKAILFVGVCLLALGSTFPLVEDEDGNWVELIPLTRVPRRAPPPPLREVEYQGEESRPVIAVIPRGQPIEERYEPMTSASIKEPVAAETGYGHSHHPYDYVDYGAYTGGWGAFGWYTDHPVHTHGHSGY